ncbi:AbrB/MazE/SpoVT family DNA-binding domain-containing protein [Candidatus Saccharibacteria bacterium]|nr:MAG: AbrB/MazE/SpoVT family DNA-binding domain-containing protein [Candidatus Saccharibacteria bacterium]
MNITQHVRKWGNGTGVRLPRKVVEAARLTINQPLEISLRGRSIVLTPVDRDEDYTLATMLHGVTPEDIPTVDWGADTGAEVIDDGYSR